MLAPSDPEEASPPTAAASAAAFYPPAAAAASMAHAPAAAALAPQAATIKTASSSHQDDDSSGSGGGSISLTVRDDDEEDDDEESLPPVAPAVATSMPLLLRKRGGATGLYGSSGGGGGAEVEMMLDPSLPTSSSPAAAAAAAGSAAATMVGMATATGMFASSGSAGSGGGTYDSTGGGGLGDAMDDVVFVPGDHTDFFLLGTSGLGSGEAVERIQQALREKRPDVLLTQLCPTRMRMLLDPDASVFSFLELPPRPTYGYGGMGGGGASPMLNLSRFGSLLVARWVWRGLGRLVGAQPPHGPHGLPPSAGGLGEARVLALEYVEAVRLAATLDTRVVLGDRDLPTTISRAWDCLSPGDKAGVVLEFLTLALLPATLARHLLRLPPQAQLPVRRETDAGAEALALLIQRHPSLRPLAREAHDYLLSSLQKLDQPPTRSAVAASYYSTASGPGGGGSGGGGGGGLDASQMPRPVVLAVLGRSHLRYIQRNWGAIIDRRRLLNPRVHLRRTRSTSSLAGGSASTSGPTSNVHVNAALAWLGRYALPLLFLLALVLTGALMVRVIVSLSAPPHLGLVTGRPGGAGPAGVLLR